MTNTLKKCSGIDQTTNQYTIIQMSDFMIHFVKKLYLKCAIENINNSVLRVVTILVHLGDGILNPNGYRSELISINKLVQFVRNLFKIFKFEFSLCFQVIRPTSKSLRENRSVLAIQTMENFKCLNPCQVLLPWRCTN